ncbi:hypothetical protein J5226_11445 [Lysobacter sp. K5869]|uniref:DUF6959 family protein n=1 Tax=Lysobacter sp. K5869 TaxID=2820808 RepID=UPI001C05F309|nr:hypothetical protein [Lysobacter sp. K5869]QWP78957.1 hypothetical protein J5226_11445 [Lysobacter sp. K5869]
MTTTVDLLDPTSNSAIVKLSTRAFPGVVLQGDTLHSLYRRANTALSALDPDTQSHEYNSLELVVDTLRGCLDVYEETLARHGYSLPYFEG